MKTKTTLIIVVVFALLLTCTAGVVACSLMDWNPAGYLSREDSKPVLATRPKDIIPDERDPMPTTTPENPTYPTQEDLRQPITLTVWAPQEDQIDENSWLNVMLRRFEEAYKDEYDITWVTGVCSDYDAITKVTSDVEAAADVFFYPSDQLPTLINAQALTKLGGTYQQQVVSDNPKSLIDSVTYTDGGIYGFPYTANTWFMYYHTRVYSPDDVKSLDTMLEKGTVAFPLTNSWYIWSFYAAGGGSLFGSQGIDRSAGIQLGSKATDVTKYLVEMVRHPNFVNDGSGEGIYGLQDGSVAAMFSGPWDAYSIREALTDDSGVCHMGVAQLPTINLNGQDCQMKSFTGSKAIGVNRQSKNMGAALKLAAFLSTEEAQLLRYELRQITPSISSLVNHDTIAQDPVAVAQMLTAENTAVVQPVIYEMNEYWGPAGNFGNALYICEIALDNAAEHTKLFQDALGGSL